MLRTWVWEGFSWVTVERCCVVRQTDVAAYFVVSGAPIRLRPTLGYEQGMLLVQVVRLYLVACPGSWSTSLHASPVHLLLTAPLFALSHFRSQLDRLGDNGSGSLAVIMDERQQASEE